MSVMEGCECLFQPRHTITTGAFGKRGEYRRVIVFKYRTIAGRSGDREMPQVDMNILAEYVISLHRPGPIPPA